MNALRRPSIVATVAVASAAAFMAIGPASASSPAAWAQHDKDTQQACAAASELNNPVVHPKAVLFDDTVGMDARLVTGTWKPAHMKGAKAVMLCLYDRKARKATAQDIEVWRGALPAVAAPTPPRAPVKAPVAPTPRAP
jgi:hypothetical protein